MKQLKSLLILVLIGLLAGCAAKVPEEPFAPADLSAKLAQGYKQKVDNMLVIFDASTSMYEKHPYSAVTPFQGVMKITKAKDVALRMNESIAPLKLQGGLHVFGPTMGKNFDDSQLIYGMTGYSADAFGAAVKSIKTSGVTPLAKPIDESALDLKDSKGKIAVIIISDGKDNVKYKMSPVAAAEQLKKTYGDRVCIYTILVGDDPVGQKTLEDIASAGQCGFATSEAAIANSAGMADFVERVFLEKAAARPKPVVKKTPVPPPVQYKTESINLLVEFDFDKATIRPREADHLDEVAAFLKTHPQTSAVLEGHTDNVGSADYNMDLSVKRAESVKNYLVQKFNIAPSRLTTKGYGLTRPITTNNTEKGRQENRRVVAAFFATVKK